MLANIMSYSMYNCMVIAGSEYNYHIIYYVKMELLLNLLKAYSVLNQLIDMDDAVLVYTCSYKEGKGRKTHCFLQKLCFHNIRRLARNVFALHLFTPNFQTK